MDIQGGHLGCPWTYRGVIWDVHGHTGGYLGCQGEGAEGPTNGPKGHSLPQELGISALYF